RSFLCAQGARAGVTHPVQPGRESKQTILCQTMHILLHPGGIPPPKVQYTTLFAVCLYRRGPAAIRAKTAGAQPRNSWEIRPALLPGDRPGGLFRARRLQLARFAGTKKEKRSEPTDMETKTLPALEAGEYAGGLWYYEPHVYLPYRYVLGRPGARPLV